ncbi:MAG TPA: NAD(P)H-dependent glycerol-3-phosphate dehydrogenase [Candidatus Binataceae bacterium]
MNKVAILGAGAWGTALAATIARGGGAAVLGVRRATHLEAIRASGENVIYLPGIKLPPTLELTDDWNAAVRDAATVVMAVPSRFARGAITTVAHAIPATAMIVSVTKGIEPDTLLTMSAMLEELTGGGAEARAGRVAVLSGPGFAAEVARGKPAALVAAARDDAIAARVQELFALRPLRVYRSSDVVGVELGGAVKNVVAIAAGICDGLDLGSSARAALITRGLAEMMRLAGAAGSRRETLAGLAGLGDLVLTCTGDLSRNRALGFRIAKGEPLAPPADGVPVAEGAANAVAIRALAARIGVEMPIVSAVCRVLYEAAPANAMVEELLSRQLKAEF